MPNGQDVKPQKISKNLYDKYVNDYLNHDDFLRANDEGRKDQLNNFFNEITSGYLSNQGVEDPESYREQFVEKYLGYGKQDQPHLKTGGKEEKEHQVHISEFPYIERPPTADIYTARQDVIKPLMTDLDAEMIKEATIASEKTAEDYEKRVYGALGDVYGNEGFLYVSENPGGFLSALESGERDRVSRFLKKMDYKNPVIKDVLKSMEKKADYDLVEKERNRLDNIGIKGNQLIQKATSEAQPYIEGWEKGSFIDPQTGNRVSSPENDFQQDYKAYMDEFMISHQDETKDIQKLQSLFEDTYIRKQYWDGVFESADKQYRGEIPKIGPVYLKGVEAAKKRKYMADAEFEAASLMYLQNIGPTDIPREGKGFKLEIFGNAVARSLAGDKNMLEVEPITRDVLTKIYEMGSSKFEWTDEELEHMDPAISEYFLEITGSLLPTVPLLLGTGQGTRLLKSGTWIDRMKNGYKIIRNPVLQKAGKAAKKVIKFKDPVPIGWQVMKEVKPSRLQKAAGFAMSTLIDEIAFAAVMDFPPGTITGMNAAHELMPNFRFKGKAGALMNPFIDLIMAGAGATVGMEAGGISAMAVESLFKQEDFKEKWDQQWGNMSESSKRLLAEFTMNSLFFGSMHLFTANSAKKMTSPLAETGNYFAYVSPKYRSRVYKTAKEADAIGYTETAKSLYDWLDLYDEPIYGEHLKKQRVGEWSFLAEKLPDNFLKQSLKNYDQFIKGMESVKDRPPWEISWEEAGKKFKFKVENEYQLSMMLENAYENRAILNHEARERAKKPPEKEKIVGFEERRMKKLPPSLIEREVEEGAPIPMGGVWRGTEVIEAGPGEGYVPEISFEGNRFGTPQMAMEKSVADLRTSWEEEINKLEKDLEPVTKSIEDLQGQLDKFKGRLTIDQKKKRDVIRNEIRRLKENISENYNKIENEFIDLQVGMRDEMAKNLKEEFPNITEDDVVEITDEALMDVLETEISAEYYKEPVSKIIDNVIDDYREELKEKEEPEGEKEPKPTETAKGEGAAPPVRKPGEGEPKPPEEEPGKKPVEKKDHIIGLIKDKDSVKIAEEITNENFTTDEFYDIHEELVADKSIELDKTFLNQVEKQLVDIEEGKPPSISQKEIPEKEIPVITPEQKKARAETLKVANKIEKAKRKEVIGNLNNALDYITKTKNVWESVSKKMETTKPEEVLKFVSMRMPKELSYPQRKYLKDKFGVEMIQKEIMDWGVKKPIKIKAPFLKFPISDKGEAEIALSQLPYMIDQFKKTWKGDVPTGLGKKPAETMPKLPASDYRIGVEKAMMGSGMTKEEALRDLDGRIEMMEDALGKVKSKEAKESFQVEIDVLNEIRNNLVEEPAEKFKKKPDEKAKVEPEPPRDIEAIESEAQSIGEEADAAGTEEEITAAEEKIDRVTEEIDTKISESRIPDQYEPVKGEPDIGDELDEMTDILGDIEYEFGSPDRDPAPTKDEVRLGELANKVVSKFVNAGTYKFPSILKAVATKVDQRTMTRLLPYLKQQYGGFWTDKATDEQSEQMDLQEAKAFKVQDLDQLYTDIHKPTEGDFSDIIGNRYDVSELGGGGGLTKKIEILYVEQWNDTDPGIEKYGGPLFGEKPLGQKVMVAVITDLTKAGESKTGVRVDDLRQLIKEGKIKELLKFKHHKERNEIITDIANRYKRIGNEQAAENILQHINNVPLDTTAENWREQTDNFRKIIESSESMANVKSGKTLLPQKEVRVATPDDFEAILNSGMKRPISIYVKQGYPEEFLKGLDLYNRLQELWAFAGIDEGNRFDYHWLAERFSGGSTANLIHLGIVTRKHEREQTDESAARIKESRQNFIKAVSDANNTIDRGWMYLYKQWLKNQLYKGNTFRFDKLEQMARDTFGITDKTTVKELSELAVVEMAREIANRKDLTIDDRFNRMISNYGSQPNFGYMTSEAKILQQFSTPSPMALLMGEYTNAGIVRHVIDTTAGNGMLVIGADPKRTVVNEIDPIRRMVLEMQRFIDVTDLDAMKPFDKDFNNGHKFNAVIINPPFGSKIGGKPFTVVVDNYNLSKIEHVIAANSLTLMDDQGKAAIIIGGHTEVDENGLVKGSDRMFFNWLHNKYDVDGIFNIDGNLYSKQGTTYPIRLILVGGRKPVAEGASPLFKAENLEPVTTWSDLLINIKPLLTKPNEEIVLLPSHDANREPGTDIRSGIGKEPEGLGEPAATPAPKNTGLSESGEAGKAGSTSIIGGGGSGVGVRPDPGPVSGEPDVIGDVPDTDTGTTTKGEGLGGARIPTIRGRGEKGVPGYRPGIPTTRPKRKSLLSDKEAGSIEKYNPISNGPSGETVLPAAMVNAMEDALQQLKGEVGNFDDFVLDRLKYDSVEDMYKAFYDAQIDALAGAVYNIENGEGFICADMTGVGKGRVAGGVIRYGNKIGLKPIFITEGANLFSDFYRDLKGIGSEGLVPFILNPKFPDGGTTTITDLNTGKEIYKANPREINEVVEDKQLKDQHDFVLATYSQFPGLVGEKRRKFLRMIAYDNIVVLDESHNAAGDSQTAEFFREIVQNARGVIFLSATHAKTPKSMPIYAIKTVVSEANMPPNDMIEAIEGGGPALQEIISSQLVEAMQLVRRQRSMDGVEVNYILLGEDDPAISERHIEKFDSITGIMRDIIRFQKLFVKPYISQMNERIAKEGERAGIRKGTNQAGVYNHPYFSKVYNVIDQLLFSLKADAVGDMIIEQLKAGLKPVIGFRSTMEAMFNDMRLEMGEETKTDFTAVLERGLRGVMRITIKDSFGNGTPALMEPGDLGPSGQAEFYRILDQIREASTGVTASPIDLIIKRIEEAGYKIAEVTGRKTRFQLNEDGTVGIYQPNRRPNKTEMVRRFNNEPGWVILANVSGATGISAHTDPNFKDINRRVMTIIQAEPDVNKEVQERGRIHRAGQLVTPVYNYITTKIPAEMRLTMMTKRKLKSLDANTTSNQKQSKEILESADFLNKYGNEIVVEYLQENPEINDMLGDPCNLNAGRDADVNKTNAAHRVTGKVAILPTELQREFYDEIIERYESHIKMLNDTDMNDLEVTAKDLQAKTISADVVIEGKGGYSAFGDDSVMELADVNVLTKPMMRKEIEKIVNEELGKVSHKRVPDSKLTLADLYSTDLATRMADFLRNNLLPKRQKDINDYIDQKIKDAHEKAKDSKKDPEDVQRSLEDELEKLETLRRSRLRLAEDNIGALETELGRYITFFKTGEIYEVPFELQGDYGVTRMNKGVFLGFNVNENKKNPWTLSNVRAKFATQDSRRSFQVPLSKKKYINSLIAANHWIDQSEKKAAWDEWDKNLKGLSGRIKRFIITRNILQAFAKYKGQLIEYTTEDGVVIKGILLPENFEFDTKGKVVVRIKKMEGIIKGLQRGDFIESTDGEVIILKGVPDYKNHWQIGDEQHYQLKVPSSRKAGRKFWDKEVSPLPDLINMGKFEQVQDRMVGYFPESKLREILNSLDEKFSLTVEIDSKNLSQGGSNVGETVHELTDETTTWNKTLDEKTRRTTDFSSPYSETIHGGAGLGEADRIQPDPIFGKKPKKFWEIQFDISKVLGRIKWEKPRSRKAAGTYTPSTAKIIIRFQNDINSLAHELGHALDDLFGLVGPEASGRFGEFDLELRNFWIHGSKPKRTDPDSDAYRRAEGVAEYMRAWMINQEQAERRAPVFTDWIKERIPEEFITALREFGDDIRTWYGASDLLKGTSIIDIDPQKETGGFISMFKRDRDNAIGFELNWADRFTYNWLNMNRPWEKAVWWAKREKGITELLPDEDPEILGGLLAGRDDKYGNMLEKGLIDPDFNRLIDPVTKQLITLKWLLEPYNTVDEATLKEDIEKGLSYMVAKRTIEIAWKLEGRLMMDDLNTYGDRLPPLELLENHPAIYRKFKEKIDAILEWAADNDIPFSRLFFPKERYDFTNETLSGMGAGFLKDYEMAERIVSEVENDSGLFERYGEAARRYQMFGDAILQYLAKSGRISWEAYEWIRDNNLHYVAMQRIMATEPFETSYDLRSRKNRAGGRPGLGVAWEPIHPIKGSARPVKNPYDSILEILYRSIYESDRNAFMKSFTDLLRGTRQMYEGDTEALAEIGSRVHYIVNKKTTFPVFVDGQKELWNYNPLIADALSAAMSAGADSIPVMRFLPKLLRNTVINAPQFVVKNRVRDFVDALIKTRHPLSLKDFTNRAIADNMLELGGGGQFGYFVTNVKAFHEMQKKAIYELAKDPSKIILDPVTMGVSTFARGYKKMAKMSERATRIEEFNRGFRYAKNKLKYSTANSIRYASFHSRRLLDFFVGGYYAKMINKYAPFFNPNLQGKRMAIKAIGQRPVLTAIKWALYSLTPALLNSLLIAMTDEKKQREYKEMQPWRRDLFYNFPIPGTDRWIVIPKPFEWGLVASAVQRLGDKILLNDEHAFDGYFLRFFLQQWMPFDDASLLSGYQGILQLLTKYDVFRNKYTIPPSEMGTDVRYRHYENSSQFAKDIMILSSLFNEERRPLMDPRSIDNFIQKQMSYYGTAFLKTYEAVRGGESQFYKWDWTDTGLAKYSPVYDSKDVQWIVKMAKRHRLEQHEEYRALMDMIGKYFDAESPKKRYQAVDPILKYAEDLRKEWEEHDFYSEYEQKQEEKRRKEERKGKRGISAPPGISR